MTALDLQCGIHVILGICLIEFIDLEFIERRVVEYFAVRALSMNRRGRERKIHGEVISLPMLHVETRP